MRYSKVLIVIIFAAGCSEVKQNNSDLDLEKALSLDTKSIVIENYSSLNSLVPYGVLKSDRYEELSREERRTHQRKQTIALGKALSRLSDISDWNTAEEFITDFLVKNSESDLNGYLTIHLYHYLLVKGITENLRSSERELEYLQKMIDLGYPDINVAIATIQKNEAFIDDKSSSNLLSEAEVNAQSFISLACSSCIEEILAADKSKLSPDQISFSESPNKITESIAVTLFEINE